MKKQFAIVCAVFVLLLGALCSCNDNAHPSNSSGNNSHISNASGNNSHVSNASSNDTSSDDNLLENASNSNLINCDLNTTSVDLDFYTVIEAGKYLGVDFPNVGGTYFKEIYSYEEFSANVEHPNVIDERIFTDNFILVIQRVSYMTVSEIGYKNYDFANKSIELIVYPSAGGDAMEETLTDFLIVPRGMMPSIDGQGNTGKLDIIVKKKSYYEMQHFKSNEKKTYAHYFENVTLANEFLRLNGYDELPHNRFADKRVLILCLNTTLECRYLFEKSCYLGFNDFNTNGKDIYITLERNIVNEDYGKNATERMFCIAIPNNLVCDETVDNPNIHILVQNNVVSIEDNENR